MHCLLCLRLSLAQWKLALPQPGATWECRIANTTAANLQPMGWKSKDKYHRLPVLQWNDSEMCSTQCLRESPAGLSPSCAQSNLLINILIISFSPFFVSFLPFPSCASQDDCPNKSPVPRSLSQGPILRAESKNRQNEARIFSLHTPFNSNVHSFRLNSSIQTAYLKRNAEE